MDELRAKAELGLGCFLEGCFFPDTEGMTTVREPVLAALYRHHTLPRTAPLRHRTARLTAAGLDLSRLTTVPVQAGLYRPGRWLVNPREREIQAGRGGGVRCGAGGGCGGRMTFNGDQKTGQSGVMLWPDCSFDCRKLPSLDIERKTTEITGRENRQEN